MTLKGVSPIPMQLRLTIARLMQLHADTHPHRIAAAVGLTAPYCRRLWRELETEKWPTNQAALQTLSELKRRPQTYTEHEAEHQSRDNAAAGLGDTGAPAAA